MASSGFCVAVCVAIGAGGGTLMGSVEGLLFLLVLGPRAGGRDAGGVSALRWLRDPVAVGGGDVNDCDI